MALSHGSLQALRSISKFLNMGEIKHENYVFTLSPLLEKEIYQNSKAPGHVYTKKVTSHN